MTQSQITYFLTVAKTLSFSKAATELFVSQPAVSKQISLLEEELGLTLFGRTRQGVYLTEAGHRFNELFQGFTRQLHQTIEDTRRLTHLRRVSIRVGCSDSFRLSEYFASLLRLLKEKFPGIDASFSSGRAQNLLTSLEEGELDLILSLDQLEIEAPQLTLRRLQLPHSQAADYLSAVWSAKESDKDKANIFREILNHLESLFHIP